MLRIQRSVETAYSQVNYLAQDMLTAESGSVVAGVDVAVAENSSLPSDPFRLAERESEANARREIEESAPKRRAIANPEEIRLEEEGEEGARLEEEEEEDMLIKQRPVPSAVYGSAIVQ
jgi:hypothetical protein